MKKRFTTQFEKILLVLLFIVLPYSSTLAQADAGSDQTVCQDNWTLNGSPANGTWSVTEGSATIVNPTLYNTQVTNLAQGINTFTWTVPSEGSDNVNITNNSVTANAGTDFETCVSNVNLNATVPIIGSGTWTEEGGNFATIVEPSLNNTAVNNLRDGLTTFRWTVTNESCSDYDIVQATNNQPHTNAGSDGTTCDNTYQMSGNYPDPEATGLWSFKSGTGDIAQPSIYNTNVTNLSLGTVELYWTINKSICSDKDSVTITNNTVTAEAGPEQNISQTETQFDANNPALQGATGDWAILSGMGTIAEPTLYNSFVNGLQNGTNKFQWKVSKGGCWKTDSVEINVSLTIYSAGSDQEICKDSTNLDAQPFEGGFWTLSENNTGTPPEIVSSSVFNTKVRYMDAMYSPFEFVWNANGTSDTVIVANNTANAFIDESPSSICKDEWQLTANDPSADNANGLWTTTGAATYDDPTLFNSWVRNLEQGENELKWTVTKGICTADDAVIISNNSVTANAGMDGESCDSTYYLSGNMPAGSTGYWTPLNGGDIVDQTLYNTQVIHLNGGTSKFEWSISSGECNDIDTVSIINNTVTAYAGEDQEVCATSAAITGNTPSGDAAGDWTPVNTSVYFDDHAINSTTVQSLDAGENPLAWTISRGICSASDTVVVTYLNNYIADAGLDRAIYSDNYPELIDLVTLDAVAPSTGTGAWSVVQGIATIDNTALTNSIVRGLERGTNIFRWTINTDNGNCTSFDDVIITTGFSFMPDETATQLDWTNPDDWDNGAVPGEGDSVTIVNVDAYLQNATAYCHALYISSGSEFNISGNGTLFADGIDLSKNNLKFKGIEGEAHMIVAGDGILKIGYGSSLKATGSITQGGLRIGSGGSVIIEQDAEKATGSGGLLSVRSGSIIIEQDAEKATTDGGTLIIRGSVIIEQDAEKSTSFKDIITGNDLVIRSGGSVIIEQDAEKSTAAGGLLQVRGGSVIIEQDAEKATYRGGSLHVRSGSVIIEQDAEKATGYKSISSGKLIVRGGSVIIEQDAEKSTYKTEIIAPSTEIYHGQIIIGKLSNTKVTGSGLRTGSIIIEQDAEKSTDVDTSLIIKTGGSLSIDESLNQGTDYSILLNSNTYVTFEKGSFIDLDYAQTGNPKPIVIKQNASLLDMNDTDQLPGKFEHLFIQNRNEQFSVPFHSINSDIFTANANIRTWDEANLEWNKLTSSQTFNYMEGFDILYTYANYLSASEGTLNSGNLSLDLDYSESTGSDQSGWNLCGNPYPSTIDFELYESTEGVSSCIYQYDNTSKQYKTYQKGGISLNGGIQYIVPGQAFFVRASNATASLDFNNNMRLHYYADGNTTEYEAPSNFLKFKVDNGTYSDETIIRFIDAATNDYDETYDAYKLLSPDTDVPQLYSLMGTEKSKTAINSLKPPGDEAFVVPLNFKAGIDGTYKITATDLNFDNSVAVVLKDLKDNSTHDLKSLPEYTFTYSTSDAEERFEVQFGAGITGLEYVRNNLKVDIYSFGTNLFIKTFDNENYQYEIYDLNGKLIKRETLYRKGLNTIKLNSPSGIYIVKVISGNNRSQKSISIIN